MSPREDWPRRPGRPGPIRSSALVQRGSSRRPIRAPQPSRQKPRSRSRASLSTLLAWSNEPTNRRHPGSKKRLRIASPVEPVKISHHEPLRRLTLSWLGLSAALRREVVASLKRRRDLAILIVVLLLGWVIWLHRMGVNDHDDAVSNELIFAREPVMTIVSSIPWGDQSPLYFLALHVARNLGESPFTIQLLNAILLTLTLVSTYALGRASFGPPAALG